VGGRIADAAVVMGPAAWQVPVRCFRLTGTNAFKQLPVLNQNPVRPV